MKHGDKKGKSVKAATQASAKEKRSENGGKKAAGKAHGEGRAPKAAAKKAAGKESSAAEARKAAKRAAPEDVAFNNPAVAAAFKRSVKKFDTAFRRLPD